MKKYIRLRDFQVDTGTMEDMDVERTTNIALFTSYEIVRLWFKERILKAPFSKLVVLLTNEATIARLEGDVMNIFGICEVRIAVDFSTLPQNAADHRWVLGRVLHALPYVEQHTGWRSPELEDFIAVTAKQELPLVHFFERLTRNHRKSGTKCAPWFSTRPGEVKIEVRLIAQDGSYRDVNVFSAPEHIPLHFFPIAQSAIRGSDFVLLDKAGTVLASVPLDEPERA